MCLTYKKLELIIEYDDESEDDYQYIFEITKRFENIKIIKNEKNLGAGMSRNIGIKSSKGNLIAFIDADDYWYKDKLEKQIKFLNKNNYQFIFCNYIMNNKEKYISKLSNKRRLRCMVTNYKKKNKCLLFK